MLGKTFLKRRREMKRLRILTGLTFTFIVSVLLIGISNTKAEGLNRKLQGTYAINTVLTCSMPWGTRTIHLQGQYTFDGNGSGDAQVTALAINHENYPTPPTPQSRQELSGSFTYTVFKDGYFEIDQPSLYSNDVIITGIQQEGWIGRGGQILVISDTDVNVETVNESIPRICGRTGTGVKLKP